MLSKILLPILLLAIPLLAQAQTPTSVPPIQLKGEGLPAGSIFVVLPSGMVAQATFGPGLTLTLDASGKPVINVLIPTPPATQSEIVGERPAASPAGSSTMFTLANVPVASSLKVFRNGIRQFATLDYNLSGQTINFVAAYSGDPSPVVVCDYVKAP